jgi:hypothetical protein
MSDKAKCRECWYIFFADGKHLFLNCDFAIVDGNMIIFRDAQGDVLGAFSLAVIAGAAQVDYAFVRMGIDDNQV